MVLRLYLIYKLLDHYNMWTNHRSKRLGNLLGFAPDSIFATKVLLSHSPIFLLSFVSLFFIGILGVLIHTFEYFDIVTAKKDFEYLWNAIWLNFITMSTVGYGDYYPSTNFGKIFCVVSCLFGIFLLSIFVAVITLLVLLDPDEFKAFNKLNEKDLIYSEMNDEIKGLFDTVGQMYKYKKQIKEGRTSKSFDEIELQRLLIRFKADKINNRKRLLGIIEESTEESLEKFKECLDVDLAECANNTIILIQCEKKLWEVANKQVEIEQLCLNSRFVANRIANLANLMRVLNTCGKIQDISLLEGRRLYNWKSIIKYYRKWFKNLKNQKKVQQVGNKKKFKSVKTTLN